MKKIQPKPFSTPVKFILTLSVIGVLVIAAFALGVFGDTTFNLTLRTNASLENGLIAHWTFDDIGTASSTATDSSGNGNSASIIVANGGILNIEGFEAGTTFTANDSSGTLSVQSSVVRTGSYALRVNPTTTGTGYFRIGGADEAGEHTNYSEETIYTRFYFRVATFPAGANEEIVHFLRTGTASKWALRLASSGELVVFDGSEQSEGTSTTALSADTWYRIEVSSDSSTSGTIEVKIDGTSEISLSGAGINTDGTNHGHIAFGKHTDRNGNTVDFYYDDISISNSAFPGEGQIEIMQVNANGSNSGWSEGTNLSDFNEVDELPHDDTTTEISTTASTATSTFNMESASSAGVSGTVNAVRAIGITQDDGGTANGLKVGIISGSTEDFSTGHDPALNYSDDSSFRVFETDPSTSSSWTQGGLDNVEVGVAVGVNNNALRATGIYMEVDFDPNADPDISTVGRLGQALEFDGVNDYATAGNLGSGIQTIAFWMKTATTSFSMKMIDIDGTDQIELNGSSQVTATSFPAATVYVDGSSASAVVATSTWQHVVITDTTGVTGSTFEIGRVSADYFGGAIDDVRVYDRALSQNEITRLHNLGATTRINTNITSNPDLENGLVGHWTFDGKDMFSNVADISGQGNNGALQGQTSTTTAIGKIGQALTFDGGDDYVSIPTASSLDVSEFTISGWFNLEEGFSASTAVSQGLFGEYENGNEHIVLIFAGTDNSRTSGSLYGKTELPVGGTGDRTTYLESTTTTWQAGRWYHVVYTGKESPADNFSYELYINGVSQVTGSNSYSVMEIDDVDAAHTIGRTTVEQAGSIVGYLNGQVDDFRMYNRALSASEISRLYEIGATTKINQTITTNPDLENGLVGHWTFDGKDMFSNVADISGQGNDGFLNGTFASATSTSIGKLGQALEFNGSDDFVDAGSGNSIDNVFDGGGTVAFWIYPHSDGESNLGTILDKVGWNVYLSGESTGSTFLSYTALFSGVTEGSWITSTRDIVLNTWNHVVVIYNSDDSGNDPTIYIDSSSKSITETSVGTNPRDDDSAENLLIGEVDGQFAASDGVIDDVRVYNRVLSADEITRLYELAR